MLSVKAFVLITLSRTWVSCTISGLSYMDTLNFKPLKTSLPGEDPCNPLYWYPKSIPDYCIYTTNKTKQETKPNPIPLPIPVPLPPPPLPFPMPMAPMPPLFSAPVLYPMPPPLPPMYPPSMPLPYGIPLAPTNPMLPVAGVPALPYPMPFSHYQPQRQAGMVPGIPGLVSEGGGINILPFSDAYADLLERHKQKLIRKKFQRIIDRYEDYPRSWRQRRHRHRFY